MCTGFVHEDVFTRYLMRVRKRIASGAEVRVADASVVCSAPQEWRRWPPTPPRSAHESAPPQSPHPGAQLPPPSCALMVVLARLKAQTTMGDGTIR
jgi:hypothetical protein